MLILPTFTTAQVSRLVNWKPKHKSFWQRRLHLVIKFLLDTGCRISEALTIRVCEIDMDNMLLTLDGWPAQTCRQKSISAAHCKTHSSFSGKIKIRVQT